STRRSAVARGSPARRASSLTVTPSGAAAAARRTAAAFRTDWLRLCARAGSPDIASVTELRASALDVLGELGANGIVECGSFVVVERTAEDVARTRGSVVPAAALPALEVLRRREQRPVEAGAEALER